MNTNIDAKEHGLRAAIYIRVSTPDQLKGYGPELQLQDCMKAAVDRDKCVVQKKHIFVDAKSGGTDDRKAWLELHAAVNRGEFDRVYFWKLDRMMRDEYFYYVNEKVLLDSNIELRFATQDLDDPFNRAVQVAVAAEEKRRIQQRTQGGRRLAAKSGKWVWGPPPYGFKIKKDTKKLQRVADEAEWVKKFFKWIAIDGLSLRGVQVRANELKVPTYQRRKRKKKQLEGFWHKKTIARILSNPIYTGTAYSYRFKQNIVGVRRFTDPDAQYPSENWICMKGPQIISPELFEKCQRQLKKNKEQAKRNLKYTYLFNKLLYCGECGLKLMAGTKLPKRNTQTHHKHYYGRRGSRWEKEVVSYKRCQHCGSVGETRLEPIWDTLRGLLLDPDQMTINLKIYSNRASAPDSSTDDEALVLARKRLSTIPLKLKRLDHVYLESVSLTDHEYAQRKAAYNKEKEEITQEVERLQRNEFKKRSKKNDIHVLKELGNTLKHELENSNYDTKSKIIHLLVKKISIHKAKSTAEVHLNLPSSDLFKGWNLDTGDTSDSREKACWLSDERLNVGHTTNRDTTTPFVFNVGFSDLREKQRQQLRKNRACYLSTFEDKK